MVLVRRLELNLKEKEDFLGLMSTSLSLHSIKWLEWKYTKNPIIGGAPIVFGAIDKDSGKLIGIRPFLACNIVRGNKIFKAAQPCDTVVHPDYRGKGIFTEMNKVAIEELKKDGYDLFFNFPNRNSQPGNLKMGWKKTLVFDESLAFNNFPRVVNDMTGNSFLGLGGKIMAIGMPSLSKITKTLDKEKRLANRGTIVSIEKSFDEGIENLWLNKEPSRFRVKRDAEYLNWRFGERPDKKYKYWSIRDENKELSAYMITTTSTRWGTTEGQIVDFNFTDREYFYMLLKVTLKDFLLSDNCNFISILACTESSIFTGLKRLGFIHRFQFPYSLAMPERNLLVRAINPKLLDYDLYSGNNWSLRSGDQDTY